MECSSPGRNFPNPFGFRIYQERYLTVSVHKKNIDEARTYFARVGTDIITHLSKLSSIGEELDAEQRLQIFRDFFRADQPQCFPFDMKAFAKRGSSFKDWICPQSMEFSKDCFKINERYGRVLYMQDYASYVKDDMISELCDLSRDLMLSIDILPVPTDEAVREIQNRLLGVETNVTNWQRRQNANNNFSAIVPYDMELQRKETKEMLDDLTTRDQRMMFGILTMVHMADSKKQLDSDTAKDQCPAYPDHRVHRSADSIPYPGDHAAGWYLLWAECGEQKYAGGRPKETIEWKLFPSWCQRFGKEFLGKRRDCGSGLVYGR